MSLHDVGSSTRVRTRFAWSTGGSQSPSRYSVQVCWAKREPRIWEEKRLAQGFQPVNSRSWPRNFTFWPQILWLLHDLKKKTLIWESKLFGGLNLYRRSQFTFVGYYISGISTTYFIELCSTIHWLKVFLPIFFIGDLDFERFIYTESEPGFKSFFCLQV